MLDYFKRKNFPQRIEEMVHVFFEFGIKPNFRSNTLTSIEWASYYCNPSLIRALARHGHDLYSERINNVLNSLAKRRNSNDIPVPKVQRHCTLLNLLAEGIWRSVQNGDVSSLNKFSIPMLKCCPG